MDPMVDLVLQLVKVCQYKEQYFANQFNITTVELRCLQCFNSQNNISIKELTKCMGLTSSRITYILNSLEKKKLLTREISKSDRRGINVCLTNKAVPFVENLNQSYVKFHERLLRGIPEKKREIIKTALKELIGSFKNLKRI